jgi:hypothetical protein
VVRERDVLRRISIVFVEDEAVGFHGLVHLLVELELRVISLVDEEVAVWDLQSAEEERRGGGERIRHSQE